MNATAGWEVDTNWYLIKGEEPTKNCKDDMVDFGKKLYSKNPPKSTGSLINSTIYVGDACVPYFEILR